MKRPKILSASFVRTINQPGRYGDGRGGHGLSLLVKPMANGRLSKSWSQRLLINGKPVNIGLGAYPLVSLADTRRTALENRQALLKGRDPRGSMPLFSQAAEEVIEIHALGWRDGGKSANQWRASLRDYAMPKIGHKRINTITTSDILGLLLQHWHDRTETMRRVKQRIGAVMKWAAERTNQPREVCELALAHVNSNQVEAAYQRSDLFELRRRLMEQWAGYLAAEKASVTAIR